MTANEAEALERGARRDAADRARLESIIAELMGNFGAHSRNAVRGILNAINEP